MQAYAILFADFSAFSVRLAVSEVLVVLVSADFPRGQTPCTCAKTPF